MTPKQLTLGERLQREHALGQPRMTREHLSEATEAVLGLAVLLEKSVDVQLFVQLWRAERELGQCAQRGLEAPRAHRARAITRALGPPRPGAQRQQRWDCQVA